MRKKKILIALVSVLLMLGCLAVSAEDTANVDFAWSIDGDKATVVVSVSGCDEAKSMMLTPVYDSSALEMQSGQWLLKSAAIKMGWSEKDPNAVLTFSSNTSINQDVFEMTFKIIGDNAEAALEDVKCRLILKAEKNGKEVKLPVYVEGLETEGCKHANTQNTNIILAGCTSTGYTSGVYCNDCREYISGHVAISPTGHVFADAWSSDASQHWHQCSGCGKKADAAAHSPGTAATVSSPQLCTVCGYVIVDKLSGSSANHPSEEPQGTQNPSAGDTSDDVTTPTVTQPPEIGDVDPVPPIDEPTVTDPPTTEPTDADVTDGKADETSVSDAELDETDKAQPDKPSGEYTPPIKHADGVEKSDSNSISIPILIVICGCSVIIIVVVVCLLNIKKHNKTNQKRGKNDENSN